VPIQLPTAGADAVAVALAEEEAAAAEGLAALGRVERLAQGIVALRLKSPAGDPREAWRDTLARCPEAKWAAPVLRDVDGNELWPTGALVVRFRRPPSAKELDGFAAAEELVVVARNEFVPEQASFRPRRPRAAYLPDLVARVARRAEVVAAWAGTASRYRKTEKG
jgi:hypothetical protein